MGMVEFGQYFYIKHAFETAIRDGLRYGIGANATQAQMVSTISTTLAQSNVTFNSSWLTVADISAGVVESDISQVPQGDLIQMTLSTNYSSLPAAVRPLSAITGKGIGSGKMMTVSCVMGKE
jgi:hypothetical protein